MLISIIKVRFYYFYDRLQNINRSVISIDRVVTDLFLVKKCYFIVHVVRLNIILLQDIFPKLHYIGKSLGSSRNRFSDTRLQSDNKLQRGTWVARLLSRTAGSCAKSLLYHKRKIERLMRGYYGTVRSICIIITLLSNFPDA